jgi:hypothetical protein
VRLPDRVLRGLREAGEEAAKLMRAGRFTTIATLDGRASMFCGARSQEEIAEALEAGTLVGCATSVGLVLSENADRGDERGFDEEEVYRAYAAATGVHPKPQPILGSDDETYLALARALSVVPPGGLPPSLRPTAGADAGKKAALRGSRS